MPLSQIRSRRAVALPSLTQTMVAVSLLAAFAGTAHAQTAASGASPTESASERARREGDKVFQWIRIHSDKPRKAVATSEKAPAATAAPAAPGPAKAAKAPARSSERAADGAARTTPAGSSAETQAAPKMASANPQEPASTQVTAAKLDAAAPLAAAAPQAVVEEDESLTPVFRSEPEFPGAMMRTLRKGQVQVAFTVQPDGSVSEVRAVSSSHPRLAPSAVSTVSQWKFRPVRHAQQAVVDLGFNLD